jgi:hypothetical protein
MEIEDYLLEGEGVRKEIHTEGDDIHQRDWDWFVTSERVIKHGSGLFGDEQFHDISLEKVSGISFESGRENTVLGVGLFLSMMFFVFELLPSGIFSELPLPSNAFGILGLGVLVFFAIAWYDSKSSYLQLHGGDSSDRWKIEVSGSAADSEELHEFAMVLRMELAG